MECFSIVKVMVYFDLFNFPNIIQFGFWGNIQKVQTLIERPVNSKKPIQSGLPNDITLKMAFQQPKI